MDEMTETKLLYGSGCRLHEDCFTCPLPDCGASYWDYMKVVSHSTKRFSRCPLCGHGNLRRSSGVEESWERIDEKERWCHFCDKWVRPVSMPINLNSKKT